MRRGFVRAGLLIAAAVWAAPAYAQSPWTHEFTYGARLGGKLVYGLKNALLGWARGWVWRGFRERISGCSTNCLRP